ncbi:hypothetical protein AYI68_g544 [Smittium mucronatum]|uniref:Retinoic acid induced 16-like protein n=1 Tax=Smittium mucronatum TaxID=133383 RepID=A0A1R0H7V4_9FUNG|nr:hypothetical protein AYI68_g544 [Smittium mucronatum]
MEFFASFAKKISITKKPVSTSEILLQRFEKAWESILKTRAHTPKIIDVHISKTPIPQYLHIISDLLLQEEAKRKGAHDSTFGVCMEFFLKNDVLGKLVKIAYFDLPIGFRSEIMMTVSNLVNILDESFLMHKNVHNPILEIFKTYNKHPSLSEKSKILQKSISENNSVLESFFQVKTPNSHLEIFSSSLSSEKNLELLTTTNVGGISKIGARGWTPAKEIWQESEEERRIWEKKQFEIQEQDLVELMYIVSSKIHGYPPILSLFFFDNHWKHTYKDSKSKRRISNEASNPFGEVYEDFSSDSESETDSGIDNPRFEFDLFTNLLKHVHKDDKIGDYSRIALLFLIELAFPPDFNSTKTSKSLHSLHLEKFIIDQSGFASVISASLVAVYSQLPSRVSLGNKKPEIVPAYGNHITVDFQKSTEFSIKSPTPQSSRGFHSGTIPTQSQEFRKKIMSYTKILEFVQDIYSRSPSPNIKAHVLQNLQDHFLATVLYPGILESSDADGSGVSVMLYLEKLLLTLSHDDFSRVILNFFNGLPELNSEILLNLSPDIIISQSTQIPLQFTLRDLICANIQGTSSSDSIISSLRLLRIVLLKWCPLASSIIETEPVTPSQVSQPWLANNTIAIDIHRRELEIYSDLAVNLNIGARSKTHNRIGARNSLSGTKDLQNPKRKKSLIISMDGTPYENDELSTLKDNYNNNPYNNFTGRDDFRSNTGQRTSYSSKPEFEGFFWGFDSYLDDARIIWKSHANSHLILSKTFDLSANSHSCPSVKDVSHSISPELNDPTSNPLKIFLPKEVDSPLKDKLDLENVSNHDSRSKDSETPVSRPSANNFEIETNRPRIKIQESDPIIRGLISLLSRYFTLSPDCNIALTGVITTLICCPFRSPDGWLTFDINLLMRDTLSKTWESWIMISEEKSKRLGYVKSTGSFSKTIRSSIGSQNLLKSSEDGESLDLSDSDGEFPDMDSLRSKSVFFNPKLKQLMEYSIDNNGDSKNPNNHEQSLQLEKIYDSSDKNDYHSNSKIAQSFQDLDDVSLKDMFESLSLTKFLPEFDQGFRLDINLERMVSELPNGASQPMMYAVMCGLVNQVSIVCNKFQNYSSRLRRTRNGLMGIIEHENDLDQEFELEYPFDDRYLSKNSTWDGVQSDDEFYYQEELNNKSRLNHRHNDGSLSTAYNSNSIYKSEFTNIDGEPVRVQNPNSDSERPHIKTNTKFNEPNNNNAHKDIENQLSIPIDRRDDSSSSMFFDEEYTLANIDNEQLKFNNNIEKIVPRDPNREIKNKKNVSGIPQPSISQQHKTPIMENTNEDPIESFRNPISDKDTMVFEDVNNFYSADILGLNSLSVPPPNINLKDFLENIIILQESLKEIVASLQVRREYGYDDDSIL